MKVVILAGGYGTRLGEYTDVIPKPMVEIGGKPILWHLMQTFCRYGFTDFSIALGYKAEVIKDYFERYHKLNSDLEVDLASGAVKMINEQPLTWKVGLYDTGLASMTGGRIKALQDKIGDEPFIVTYGDGLANVDLESLVNFHKKHGRIATVTAVHPIARFGELHISGIEVEKFSEKPQTDSSWINGGFFVFNPEIFDYIADSSSVLEKEPLESLAAAGQLCAYRHEGFWQCMDTKRDRTYLEQLYAKSEIPPWMCD